MKISVYVVVLIIISIISSVPVIIGNTTFIKIGRDYNILRIYGEPELYYSY